MKLLFSFWMLALPILVEAQHQLYNDEFDQSNFIENWSNINETEGWGIQQLEWYNIQDSSADHFQIAPHTSAWFNEYKGSLVYKEIKGDFVITTEVQSNNRINDTRPTSRFSLAGLLIREPLSYNNGITGWSQDEQNYVFLAMGYANGSCSGACQAQLEVKTTVNSSSSLSITNIGRNRVQLRAARIGNALIVLYREIPGGEWILHRRYNRSDFPETLQVGFTTYTDWDKVSAVGFQFHNQNILTPPLANDPASGTGFNPSLIAEFDFYRLDHFDRPQDLLNADFSNTLSVTNQRVLDLLGYPSEVFCPDRYIVDRPVIDMPRVHNAADTIHMSSTISGTNTSTFSAQEWIALPLMQVDEGGDLTILNAACVE